jgi:hypothetical protein
MKPVLQSSTKRAGIQIWPSGAPELRDTVRLAQG